MINKACVIVLEDVTTSDREAIDELIIEHSIGYWHKFADLWIVGGQSVDFWAEAIERVLAGGSSNAIVLSLPKYGSGRGYWAFMIDVEKNLEWLRKNYQP